jgi:hypothetical protein
MKNKPKQESKSQLSLSQQPRQNQRQLATYPDYVSLMEDLINQVLYEDFDLKRANTVGALANYGLNALRSATGGKMRMNVYLQQVRSVDVSGLSREQMDQFLQGNEEVQLEVLKQIEDKGGLNTAEIKPVVIKPLTPKVNTEMVSQLTGLTEEQAESVFKGEKEEIEFHHTPHNWDTKPGGGRWCQSCGKETDMLQMEDAEEACSEVFGLV